MKTKINIKKAILWGTILIVIQMIIGNVFYMNPYVANIYKEFEGHHSLKTFEFIGGFGNWIILTMIFGIFLMIVWIFLFILFYSSLPGKGWIKGLYFGIIIGFVKSFPEAFNQWMLINYPTPLIFVQLFNTFISLVIFGALLGFFFSKFKVITNE